LPQPLLFLLQSMQQIDDDIPYLWQIPLQALLCGILAQRLFQDCPKHVGDRPQIGGVDIDRVESATSNVELISEAHIDIGNLALGRTSC
jgi:hypothetical protein